MSGGPLEGEVALPLRNCRRVIPTTAYFGSSTVRNARDRNPNMSGINFPYEIEAIFKVET